MSRILPLLLVILWGCSGEDPEPTPRPDASSTSEKAPRNAAIVADSESGVKDVAEPVKTDAKEEGTEEQPELPAKPQPVYRPDDTRPVHDETRLAKLGIHPYESRHLRLYTDLDPEIAKTLPPVIDQAYAAWVEYFGDLPPNRAGTPFQMTGYLIVDKDRFERSGLVPADLPVFENGRHRGAEFWMYDQKFAYYRKHLMIHEATHCFMTYMPDTRAPVWYMEGMAEYFGTHRVGAEGRYEFGVVPDDEHKFAGLGRIPELERMRREGELPATFDEAKGYDVDDYLKLKGYSVAWALCSWLDRHPRYRERFRLLGQRLTGTQFDTSFREFFREDRADLAAEWSVHVSTIEHAFDYERNVIDFRKGEPVDGPATCTIDSARGWQSAGVFVRKGESIELTADGEFTLADEPKPWLSTPDGISFQYWQGIPIGRLVATIRAADENGMRKVTPIGHGTTLTADVEGTLYLKLADFPSRLEDNRGSVEVTVRRADEERSKEIGEREP